MSEMPPHDIEAEQAALGSMMLSAAALAECLEVLRPGAACFFRPAHQMLFEAIKALAEDGQPVDALTVKAEMERRDELRKAGGPDYLHDLLAAVPIAANGAHYARELLIYQMRRGLKSSGQTIGQIAEAPGLTREEMADSAHAALDRATGITADVTAVSLSSLLPAAMDALEAGPETVLGVATGWRDVDLAIPGMRPGELVVVGGRPSIGKSVVLLNVAAYAAIHLGLPVLLCSLEMSREECTDRIIASEASVSLKSIRDRVLSGQDWDRIAKAYAAFGATDRLLINDNSYLTVHDIRAELRAMQRAGMPARLVVVDYLQLMASTRARPENRQVEVSEMSRSLKKLAGEFGVPVIVGSQLNRGPEQRADRRPVAADLRESGALEQDSDIIILLYRDDAYFEDSTRSGEIDLIIAKNRQGPQATVSLAFRGHLARCDDLYRGGAA